MADRDATERRIAARHNDIPQEPLFGLPPAGYDVGTDRKAERPKSQKSIRTAVCPKCNVSASGPIGVIRVFDQDAKREREIFRDHNKFTRSGGRIPCSGSGQEAPK